MCQKCQPIPLTQSKVLPNILVRSSLTIVPIRSHATVRGGVAAHNRLCFDYVTRVLALGTFAIRGSTALVAMQSCWVSKVLHFVFLTKYSGARL